MVCNNCKKPGQTVVVCLDTYNKSNPRNRTATLAPPWAASRAVSRAPSPDTEGENTNYEDDSELHEGHAEVRMTRTRQAHGTASRPTPSLWLNFTAGPGSTFRFRVCPDTGTARTIIGVNVARKYNLKVNPKGRERITAANNEVMHCQGSVLLKASIKDVQVMINALVSQDLRHEILVVWHDLVNLKVIQAGFPNAQCRQVQNDSLDRIISDFQHSVLSDTLSKKPMARPAMHIHLRVDMPVTPMRITTRSAIPVRSVRVNVK